MGGHDRGRCVLDYEAAIEKRFASAGVDGTAARRRGSAQALPTFAPRKPRSVWAASNKARVERLLREGRVAPAGLAAIERAKANGSWTVLDGPEHLEVPGDLAAALEARPPAAANFAAFPPSAPRKTLPRLVSIARRRTRSAGQQIAEGGGERNERAGG